MKQNLVVREKIIFQKHSLVISKNMLVGIYEGTQGKEIDILIVYINEGIGLDKARTLQKILYRII